MPETASLQLLVDRGVNVAKIYEDAAAERQRIRFRAIRTRSMNGLTFVQKENLRALRLARKGRRHEIHELTRTNAGHLVRAGTALRTDIVLSGGHTVEAKPYEVTKIVREKPVVTPAEYTIDGQPGLSLQWSSGDRSRVERFRDFSLLAWSSRLTPAEAVRLLKDRAEADARLIVVFSDSEFREDEASAFERRFVESRAERVRLLRLENSDATFLWEVRSDEPEASHPDFVVMTDGATRVDVQELIGETGTLRVMLAEDAIMKTAQALGVL